MIGEISDAVLQECKALQSGTGASVMLKTNLAAMKKESYSGNFILLDIQDAQPSEQYPNGLTRMDWKLSFNTYQFEGDAMVDDNSGYATGLLNYIDGIREHFSSGLVNNLWLTAAMTTVWETWGFQFTFGGITVADALEESGFLMGWKIDMESTALDPNTLSIVPSANPLENVTQIGNPPFDNMPDVS